MTSPGGTREVLGPSGWHALFAACIGNAVEWYDFVIYGALDTVIIPLFFPSDSQVLRSAFAL